jgi:hypothetical protein
MTENKRKHRPRKAANVLCDLSSVLSALLMPLVAGVLWGCAGDHDAGTGEPSFYRSMAEGGAQVDAATAASMI